MFISVDMLGGVIRQMTIETNIYPISNLGALSSKYLLYRIRGLNSAPAEYYQNCQNIIRQLSFTMRSPVTIIHREAQAFLVVQEGKNPPESLPVIRTVVKFEPLPEVLQLDYTVRNAENDTICMRFLDFAIQGALFKNTDLWQPSAGRPFFEKQAENLTQQLVRFPGYSVRSAVAPNGQLGFCIDVTSKTVSREPLPAHISQDEFADWKNRNFIYHYGHQWYEIQLTALSDFDATEYIIPGTQDNLLSWVVKECRRPIPTELADAPHDASVAIYLNNQNESRAALAPLCYAVFRTNDNQVSQQHNRTILPPHVRRQKIRNFVGRYLSAIPFGENSINVSTNATDVEARIFAVPDTVFGQNKILSVRSTPGALHTSLDKLGETRMALLRDDSAGFFTRKPLGRHYLILPQSVADSFGTQFVQDLKASVMDLYPHQYDPFIVTYNDRVAKTFPKQGNAILSAVRNKCKMPGYAVVMIHHTTDRGESAEDELAAMVMRELREPEIDIKATVIHPTVGQECYEQVQRKGNPVYEPRAETRGKLRGYLRMVAINKVLLNNECWPFLLSSRLHAELTVGLDVKHHTAGLIVVGKNGGEINTSFKTSRQKEKLTEEQIKAYLVEIIREEANARTEPISTIVLQRDGRIFDTEIQGVHGALDLLKAENVVSPDATITIVEIPKTSPVRLRLFDVGERYGRPWVENPQIGTYCIVGENDGYLCATGRAFYKPGTVRPLHVHRVEGSLSISECLEDVYYLASLTWTRPNDAMRDPVTVKLNDRFLGEEAAEYDANALDIDAILDEKEEMRIGDD